jgi:hypothetical protein
MLALTAVLALALQVEEAAKPPAVAGQPPKLSDWHTRDVSGIDVSLRVTGLGGQLDGDEDWSEFFDAGTGIGVGYEHLWKVSKVAHAGLYGTFSYDHFSGETNDMSDDLGTLLVQHDDMNIIRLVFGGRIRESFKSFFMDQSVGIGFALYSQTDVKFSDGVDSVTVTSIESSTAFTLELRARFGFYISDAAMIFMGFAFEQNGAPDEGSEINSLDINYEANKNFVWTLGASFNF